MKGESKIDKASCHFERSSFVKGCWCSRPFVSFLPPRQLAHPRLPCAFKTGSPPHAGGGLRSFVHCWLGRGPGERRNNQRRGLVVRRGASRQAHGQRQALQSGKIGRASCREKG